MLQGFDLYIETSKENAKYIRKYKEIGKKIKDFVLSKHPESRVYIFGSIIEGKATLASDIDILIVIDKISIEEKYKLKALIYMMVKAPIELHIVSEEEFTKWYKRFITKIEEI
ncbi:MAG: nucleotidyltransferase domain-containing protein [Nitrososphaerota archaeon]